MSSWFKALQYRGLTKKTFPSETKQKTLEEIAAAFGDKVVLVDDLQRAAEGLVAEEDVDLKPDTEELERHSSRA